MRKLSTEVNISLFPCVSLILILVQFNENSLFDHKEVTSEYLLPFKTLTFVVQQTFLIITLMFSL